MRLSLSSLAGMDRTLVAVGTVRLAAMLSAVRAAAPRSRSWVPWAAVAGPAALAGPVGVPWLVGVPGPAGAAGLAGAAVAVAAAAGSAVGTGLPAGGW